jgi:hypothetical protein
VQHVQGAPLNDSDHCGDPPLLLAAGNGEALETRTSADQSVTHYNAMELLSQSLTCIIDSVLISGHKACVQLLLDEGADIEQRNVVHPPTERTSFWGIPVWLCCILVPPRLN